MRTLPTLPALALTALAFASGCGEVAPSDTPDDVASKRATLHRSRDCNELLGDLRADTVRKINKQIDGVRDAIRDCRAALGSDADLCGHYYLGSSGGSRGEFSADDSASPTAPNAGGESAGRGDSPTYSETNTQVKGVDEADIVKSDGARLYVLHGSTFRVLSAYPTDALGELSVTELEGAPTEMYVENGVAVIYSQVDGTPVYSGAGITPPSQKQQGGSPGVGVPVAPGGNGYYPGYSADPLTKITVLRIGADFQTAVAKETYLEGSYLSSRRVDAQVRTILQGAQSGDLSMTLLNQASQELGLNENSDILSSLELLRKAAIGKVATLELDRWLPRTFEKRAGAVTARSLACENSYTPTAGTTEDGLTQVSTMDLNQLDAAPQDVAIFGRASTVYGNAGSLYLAAAGSSDMPFGGNVGVARNTAAPTDDAPSASPGSPTPSSDNVGLRDEASTRVSRPELPEVITLARTHVHKFSFDAGGAPVYVNSGTVDGTVKDQFALDERDGVLRIATTEQRMYRSDFEGDRTNDTRPRSLNHVFALSSSGGELVQRGAVKDLAPDENIYSVRFLGPKAYVVTFRQVDPLFVLDFANPDAPSKLGELKIPGFSEYMHPLDDNHLLTIGKEADENGRVLGLALQIFDVSNPTAPAQRQKYVYSPDTYGHSEASYNHKAFTYYAQRGVLAFPYTSYDPNTGGQSSTLELFQVSSSEGFTRLGGIEQETARAQNSCVYVDPSVRRGLFIEDVAYSLSFSGIIAKRIDDLAGAGSTLAFPNPYPQTQCGGGEDKPSGG